MQLTISQAQALSTLIQDRDGESRDERVRRIEDVETSLSIQEVDWLDKVNFAVSMAEIRNNERFKAFVERINS